MSKERPFEDISPVPNIKVGYFEKEAYLKIIDRQEKQIEEFGYSILALQSRIETLEKIQRPQGEWIYDKSIPNWVCSECGAVPSDWGGTTNSKYTVTRINRFCRLCGADMRKEAEHE